MAVERRLEDVVRQFDRQSDVMPRMKWFADADRAKELLRFARFAHEERVLEVGCGPGIVLEQAAPNAGLLVGVDVSPQMLVRAQERVRSAGLARAMVERLPFRDGAFDLAVCRSVLHHVMDPAAMIREMARVVRRGGRVAVNDSMASKRPNEAANHNLIERLRDPSHGRMVPPSELRRFFEAAGLEVLEVVEKRYPRWLDEWLDITSPPLENPHRVEGLFETWTGRDESGLSVRREAGRVRFDHTQWTVLAEKC